MAGAPLLCGGSGFAAGRSCFSRSRRPDQAGSADLNAFSVKEACKTGSKSPAAAKAKAQHRARSPRALAIAAMVQLTAANPVIASFRSVASGSNQQAAALFAGGQAKADLSLPPQ